MPLINVFTAKDTVDDTRRQTITQQLMADILEIEGAPDSDVARSISWVLWHDVDDWWAGDERVGAGDPPRYLVRVEAPAAALKSEAKRKAIIERVTAALAKADDDPDRLSRESVAWVIIDEVPGGNWGSHGRVVKYEEIMAFIGAPIS